MCSVQYVFFYLWPKFLKNTFEQLILIIGLFKENSHSHGKFTERIFLLQFLCIKFFEQIFLRTSTCSWWMKNQQNLSTKIKTWLLIVGARNCLLKIMSLRAIILHKTDLAIFSVLRCVTSWAMCLTDKYLWKTSPNKLRSKSATPATPKQE